MTALTPGYMPATYNTTRTGNANTAGGARLASSLGQYWGHYKVTGTTVKGSDSTPVAALVLVAPEAYPNNILFQQRTTVLSNTYCFNNLAAGNYIVTAIDETGTLDAAVHALVAAVAM